MDDLFMDENTETLKNINKKIKYKFNIQESGKVNNFIRVYYE